MNLRHPYEQLIADKLRKLPAPGADASWQQMKQLLDDDEDRGGGAKRPPGNKNGWWRIGVLAIVLSASLWLYVEKTNSNAPLAKNKITAPATANNKTAETGNSTAKNTSNSNNNKTAIIDNNTTLPVASTTTVSASNDKINDKITAGAAGEPVAAHNSKNNSPASSTMVTSADRANENKVVKTSPPGNEDVASVVVNGNSNKRDPDRNPVAAFKTSSAKNKKDIAGVADNNIVNNSYEKKKQFTEVTVNNNGSYSAGKNNGKANGRNKDKNSNQQRDGNFSGQLYTFNSQPTGIDEKILFGVISTPEKSAVVPSSNTSLLLAGDSIESKRNTNNLLNAETKKQVAKAQRDKELEDMSKKEKKSFHLNLSNVFKPFSLRIDADPRWAAGISLNSGITVNAQSRYNYNMNGKSGTLSDYIPSLYLQFHLNDYVYAQTEINFISPQYTPQLLVYQQSSGVASMAGVSQQKSIYIQKLYYFNLPVSLHYSPINNFYFSAGLQFSSFQSGLVSIQEKQYPTLSTPDHTTSVSNSIVKFKDDSIAQKLSPNEWRWQAGADYYWNRFSFGLRYNRSFKDLLNVNLSGSLPATTLRNESLLFFVRYNLFESRKKGEASQKN